MIFVLFHLFRFCFRPKELVQTEFFPAMTTTQLQVKTMHVTDMNVVISSTLTHREDARVREDCRKLRPLRGGVHWEVAEAEDECPSVSEVCTRRLPTTYTEKINWLVNLIKVT